MMLLRTKIILSLLVLLSCNEIKYEELAEAYVLKVVKIHKGRGYYDLKVIYRFSHKDHNYEGSYNYNLGKTYSVSPFEAGDSLLIKFDINNPERSKFIKISYDKSFFKNAKRIKDH